MILLDTNIFLEALLEQERAETVRLYLQKADLTQLAISDFSLHSIGIILFHLEKVSLFRSFLNDLLDDGMTVISLTPTDLYRVEEAARKYHLDFDDAYQYVVAEINQLILVSFDADFDRTNIGRKEPAAFLN